MNILDKEQFSLASESFKKDLVDKNIVFVYPTDTIYGIGCNANNEEAVQKIRELKERDTNPFSIIAPSKEWIGENCVVNENAFSWIKRLPGPYTLILKVKEQSFAKSVNPDVDTIGIRMPDHWFTGIAAETGVPIVSTSANKSGEPFMTSIDNLNENIKRNVDMIIYEGEKDGTPSLLVDLTDPNEVKEIQR